MLQDLVQIPSLASKREHVTLKHDLIGYKHGMFGRQTFEVQQTVTASFYGAPNQSIFPTFLYGLLDFLYGQLDFFYGQLHFLSAQLDFLYGQLITFYMANSTFFTANSIFYMAKYLF